MDVRKLTDVFTMAASWGRSVLMPENRFSTHWFKKPGELTVLKEGANTNEVSYHTTNMNYIYAEARKVGDDAYSIHLVQKTRHNEFAVGGQNKTYESNIINTETNRSIATKETALQILDMYEKRFQKENWRYTSVQPLRFEHYNKELKRQQNETESHPAPQ